MSESRNPLQRFDLTNLWNEEDPAGESQLTELIATVQRELDCLEHGETSTSDTELQSKQLEQHPPEERFSYTSVTESAGKLHTILDLILEEINAPPPEIDQIPNITRGDSVEDVEANCSALSRIAHTLGRKCAWSPDRCDKNIPAALLTAAGSFFEHGSDED